MDRGERHTLRTLPLVIGITWLVSGFVQLFIGDPGGGFAFVAGGAYILVLRWSIKLAVDRRERESIRDTILRRMWGLDEPYES